MSSPFAAAVRHRSECLASAATDPSGRPCREAGWAVSSRMGAGGAPVDVAEVAARIVSNAAGASASSRSNRQPRSTRRGERAAAYPTLVIRTLATTPRAFTIRSGSAGAPGVIARGRDRPTGATLGGGSSGSIVRQSTSTTSRRGRACCPGTSTWSLVGSAPGSNLGAGRGGAGQGTAALRAPVGISGGPCRTHLPGGRCGALQLVEGARAR